MKSKNASYRFWLLLVAALFVCTYVCRKPTTAAIAAVFDEMVHERFIDQYPDRKRFLKPGQVPAFLNRIPEHCQTCSPGISDPGLDSAAAVKQALSRAALLHALSKPTEITFITDFYIQRIHQKQWEVFGHLFELPLSIQPMKPDTIFINQFGEAIVMAKPAKKVISKEENIILSGFIQEKTYARLSDFIYRFEINTTQKRDFVMRSVNNNFSIESRTNRKTTKTYPHYNFHYLDNTESDSAWITKGIPTSSGLWPAFFGSMMKSVFFTIKNRADYEVGSLSDNYSVALSANMKRETGNTHFSVKYKGCDIFNNMLNPHLDFKLNLEKP